MPNTTNMKITSLVILLSLFCGLAQAQEANTPKHLSILNSLAKEQKSEKLLDNYWYPDDGTGVTLACDIGNTRAARRKCYEHKVFCCNTCTANYSKRVAEINVKYEQEVSEENERYKDEVLAIQTKKDNEEYSSLISEAEKLEGEGKYDEAKDKYSQAKGIKASPWIDDRIASMDKKKADKEKRDAEKKKDDDKKKDKKEQQASKQYYIEQTQHDLDRQYAQKRHLDYQQNDAKNYTAAIALATAWVGLYLFPKPENSIYETKSRFFSFAPTTSVIAIPTFENTFEYTETEYKYYSGYQTVKNTVTTSKANSKIVTPNFGVKMEFGWIGDIAQLTFPVRGSFGLYTQSRVCYQGSGGALLFMGSRNSKQLKLGVGYEYSLQQGSRYVNEYYNYSGWTQDPSDPTGGIFPAAYDTYSTSDISNSYDIRLKTLKYGFRYHLYFNSLTYNESEPFVFDVFLTTTFLKDVTVDKNYSYVHPMYPGLEVNISKLSVFGFYARYMPMKPVGKLSYPQNLTKGATETPYFEIGIKREYSWFKRAKPNSAM